MTLYPDELSVGLKEWDSVCQALLQGKQIVMLRKGGIHEAGGEFEVEFRRFLLFPTYLHQDKDMLKEDAQELFKFAGSEPTKIKLEAFADVTDIVRIETEKQVKSLSDKHIWTDKLVQMRIDYRPENPLYLLLVRAHKLTNPVTIDNRPQYAGCKSWVGLRENIKVTEATPVLDAPSYQQQRDEIMMRAKP
jgi:hypothetical protein